MPTPQLQLQDGTNTGAAGESIFSASGRTLTINIANGLAANSIRLVKKPAGPEGDFTSARTLGEIGTASGTTLVLDAKGPYVLELWSGASVGTLAKQGTYTVSCPDQFGIDRVPDQATRASSNFPGSGGLGYVFVWNRQWAAVRAALAAAAGAFTSSTAGTAALSAEQTGAAAANNHLMALRRGGAEKAYVGLNASDDVVVTRSGSDFAFKSTGFFSAPGLSTPNFVDVGGVFDTCRFENATAGGCVISLNNTQPLCLGTNSNKTTHLVLKGDGASVGIGIGSASITAALHVNQSGLSTPGVQVKTDGLQDGVLISNPTAADSTTRSQFSGLVRFHGSSKIGASVHDQVWCIGHVPDGTASPDSGHPNEGFFKIAYSLDGGGDTTVFQIGAGQLGVFGVTPVARPAAWTINGGATAAGNTIGTAATGTDTTGGAAHGFASTLEFGNFVAKVNEIQGNVRKLQAEMAAYGFSQ